MDERLLINEAIELAESKGKKVWIGKLAEKVLSFSKNLHSAHTAFSKYRTGESTMLKKSSVHALCDELGVDANFLYETKPIEPEDRMQNNINDLTQAIERGKKIIGKDRFNYYKNGKDIQQNGSGIR